MNSCVQKDMEKQEILLLNHLDYKTPKKTSFIVEGEMLIDKISILTTKPDSQPNNAKLPSIKDFVIIKPISRGAFGKVFLGYKNTDSNKLYAIKVMRKSEMINKNMVSQVITERNALALSRSPFCVSLFYSLQSVTSVYLVMEYMVGGDLKSLLAMYGFFDEAAARFYVAEVVLALQYLHEHGIVHRDIKPDNMLLSATGHVKLTDFGLSKIEMRRDLELSDLINCSPNLNARTPGQLLSLTSHLSFGSEKKIECGTGVSNFINTINKHNTTVETSDSEADTSLNDMEKKNDSKISGVSPFYSAEELSVSMTHRSNTNDGSDSSSSYHTCSSSEYSKSSGPGENDSANNECKSTSVKLRIVKFADNEGVLREVNSNCQGCICSQEKYDLLSEKSLARVEVSEDTSFEISMRIRTSKGQEDSGVSSRKSDYSNSHINSETTTSSIDKADILCNFKDEFNSSDYSRSYNANNNTHESSGIPIHSPFRNSRNFKRPEFLRGMKRKLNLMNRSDNAACMDGEESGSVSGSTTGLTQEIDIMDIGSSTPKKRKSIRGVLKVRSLSDDEVPHQIITENVTNVVFSTPVSSTKMPRRDGGLLGKLKTTRFALPQSIELKQKHDNRAEKSLALQYLKMADDPTMSPINLANVPPKTPKMKHTPFRTPKSVRRNGAIASSERILGTPDYLAPELLLRQCHGPAVDWWALGVCFYEFMTGIPPFNDETPQKVFDNILNKNIEWPQEHEALSPDAMEAVDLLLTMNPIDRPTAKDVQQMRFFNCVDWKNMEIVEPPFVPAPDNPTDTGYFEARNNLQHLKLSNFVLEE